MAIYHFSAKPVQRSKGRSSVAAAAYRSRSSLRDERQGKTFSYTAAQDLVHAEIVGFDGPRSTLWNMAEAMETRHDATTAREYEIALPNELSEADQIELCRAFSRWLNENQYCAVDFAIHSGGGSNGHGHFLTVTRSIDKDGTMSDVKIPREWSDSKRKKHGLPGRKTELVSARKAWADMANHALAKAGFDERIDHRSLKDQGIDRLPTSHIGPAASAMERDGIQTRVGDHNRIIGQINLERQYELDELRKHQVEAKRLKQQLADIDAEIEAIRNEPVPSLNTKGTIAEVAHSKSIAEVADRESARYESGMARTFGEQFKSKLFRDLWQTDIDLKLLKSLKWVDVNAKALTLKTGEQVVDKGDSVSLSKGSDDAITAAIAMARSKGWTSVRINGSDDFQIRAALALREAGIKPSITSEIAKERFSDKLQGQSNPAVQKPELSPAPEPKPEPEPEINLTQRVLESAEKTLLPPTNAYKDDTRKLRTWALAVWGDLVADGEPEGLADIFVEVMEEHALMGGYSQHEIKDVGLDATWSKTMSDQKSTPSPRPAAETRRTGYTDSGDKPPGA